MSTVYVVGRAMFIPMFIGNDDNIIADTLTLVPDMSKMTILHDIVLDDILPFESANHIMLMPWQHCIFMLMSHSACLCQVVARHALWFMIKVNINTSCHQSHP